MQRKSVLLWEISGVFFLIVVGSLLHFVFDWSNQIPLVGVFSAVNESVWEHLKLGFWSLVLFSCLEFWGIKNKTNNFFLAKGIGVIALQCTILAIFYIYTIFTAEPILAIDISSYILGCILCQYVSYLILTRTNTRSLFNRLGLALLLIHAGLLILFTFFPPRLPIFLDSHSSSYGIQKIDPESCSRQVVNV